MPDHPPASASGVLYSPAELFDRHAKRYADHYFDLHEYDRYYSKWLSQVRKGGQVIDVACGPGNVSAFIRSVRPDLQVTGIDIAPGMIAEAQRRVPDATFLVSDCRDIPLLGQTFDGAAFAFGLSYLDDQAAAATLQAIYDVLSPNAPLYLSTLSATKTHTLVQSSSAGERMLMHYRTPDAILAHISRAGFMLVFDTLVASPSTARFATDDLIALAKRV
ncbi:class I SAM-dependent methyltransferase [Burkholderiaceae bacterium DAT-1]|nr:class I SAM-dependent methyltransferase [Burkholderiaceae bacterium DAT-1]